MRFLPACLLAPTLVWGQIQLDLGEAVRRAVAAHPDVTTQRLNLESASAEVRAAKGLFDPLFRFGLNRDRATTPSGSPFEAPDGKLVSQGSGQNATLLQLLPWGGVRWEAGLVNSRLRTSNPFLTLNPYNTTRLTSVITVPLLRGRALDPERAQLRIRAKEQRLSRQELELRALDVAARTESAYAAAVAARAALAAAEGSANSAASARQSTSRLIDAGLLPEADRAGATARHAQALEAVAAARTQAELAELNLKELVAKDAGDPIWQEPLALQGNPELPPTQPAQEWLQEARQYRPELQQVALRKEVAEVNRDLSRQTRLPKVDFSVTGFSQGLAGTEVPLDGGFFGIDLKVPRGLIGNNTQAFRQLGEVQYPGWQMGLNIELPTRNRTAEARFTQAQIELRRTGLERDRIERAIIRETLQAIAALEGGKIRLREAERAETAAQERLQSELRLLDGGKSNNLNVNTRQAEQSEAAQRFVEAKRALWQAASDLRRATASTLRAYQIRID